MSAGELFTWFLLLTMLLLILFVILLVLPGVIELLAEAITETKYSIDKLRDALRGDKHDN